MLGDKLEAMIITISIPFGAIKSFYCIFTLYGFYLISIPFGAIKSDCSERFIVACKYISIPFGAIKRNPDGHTPWFESNFNSFWCD